MLCQRIASLGLPPLRPLTSLCLYLGQRFAVSELNADLHDDMT